jgi:dipeptidyl aminopeptidase/acylaminoacyl peptidase
MNLQNKIAVGLVLLFSELTLSNAAFTQENNRVKSTDINQSTPKNYIKKLPPLIDRKVFFGDPKIANAELSPDGKFLAFQKPLNGVMSVWVKRLDEPFNAAHPVPTNTDSPIPTYSWSEDGRYIIYAQDKGGNEDSHLFAVAPTATAAAGKLVPPARDLTPIENIQARIYAIPKKTPNYIIVGLNDRNPKRHDVYRINLTTGKRELLIKNEQNIASWIADVEGNIRLARRQTSDGSTEILRVDGKSLVPVYTCNFEETCRVVRFHKDNKRVYIKTNKGKDVDLIRLILLNPQTKQSELVDADPRKEVDVEDTIFSSATEELLATVYVGDHLRIYPQNKGFAGDLDFLQKALPKGDLNFKSSTNDNNLYLITVSRDVDPGETYLYNRKTRKINKLYESRPELPIEHLAPMRPIRYTARDGLKISAYLTVPKGIEPRNLPVVVMPHGGPWNRDQWGYDPFAQFLANRGYIVFQPNFRGSSGYGQAFLNAGNKQWGTGSMQHDITDGVRYLIEQGIANPKRVAIYGGSYGGYAALAGLAFTPNLYTAGISYVGPSNILTLLNNVPPYWEPVRKTLTMRVGDPADPKDRERLRQQSPLFSAKQIKAPLLVIQGANDPRVKKAESDQIVVALRDLNRDVKYLVAPNEGHGFKREGNKLAVAAAIERFLASRLDGRYQESISPDIKARLKALTVDVKTVTAPDTLTTTEVSK